MLPSSCIYALLLTLFDKIKSLLHNENPYWQASQVRDRPSTVLFKNIVIDIAPRDSGLTKISSIQRDLPFHVEYEFT